MANKWTKFKKCCSILVVCAKQEDQLTMRINFFFAEEEEK